MTAIKARKPSGAVPWPLILIEGPEKSGKSYAAAEFTASDRIGQAYWIDIAEGAADEYAAIPGANYLVIEHDGSWNDIVGQVDAVAAEAQRAASAGEKPVVLVIDSMTAEWDLLKDWVQDRARESKAGKRALAADPDAEIKPAMNLWNDANGRHGALMHRLMTFPGIVLVTARGKEVAALDSTGKPTGQKDYKVEGHKSLAFDVTAWVRLSREQHPQVVGVRSLHAGIRPGVDRPRTDPGFTVERLIFDVMRCDPAATHVRDHVPTEAHEMQTERPTPAQGPDFDRIDSMIRSATSDDQLKQYWERLSAFDGPRSAQSRDLIVSRRAEIAEPEPTGEEAQQTLTDVLNAETVEVPA